MNGQTRFEWLIIFWHAEVVGWMVCGKENIEKAVESAFACETNVANVHGAIL